MIRARGLTFGYGERPLFEGLSFELAAGDALGVLGPNGVGKSTLLRVLAGLLRPRSGEVLLDGRPLGALPTEERARQVAYVPQGIDPRMPFTVFETVLMGRYAHLRGQWERQLDRDVARRALAVMRLEAVADHRLAEVSGGERQRALIASALAQEAPVLLLDEPTTALDLRGRVEAVALLGRLRCEDRRTVVLVTHDIDLAHRTCERVLLLGAPQGPVEGPRDEVLRSDRLEAAYGIGVRVLDLAGGAGKAFVPAYAAPAAGVLSEAGPDGTAGRAESKGTTTTTTTQGRTP
ncbi:MAG: ABC transporter ATP-binding protein [Deltaproteobacteria bacterium]|nr:ABC transporter ATP-binding protein [Deltaproteobacteria bacterium]